MTKTIQIERADYLVVVLTEMEVETLQTILEFHRDDPRNQYYSTEALDSLIDKVK